MDIKANAIQKQESLKEQKNVNTENNVNEIKQISENVKEEVSGKLKDVESFFNQKEKEVKNFIDEQTNYIKKLTTDEIEALNKKIEAIVKTPTVQEPIIRIFSTYTNSELNLPNKKYLANLGIGARLIILDEEEKIIGLEIEDVTIDYVTDSKGVPIIEIVVKKA